MHHRLTQLGEKVVAECCWPFQALNVRSLAKVFQVRLVGIFNLQKPLPAELAVSQESAIGHLVPQQVVDELAAVLETLPLSIVPNGTAVFLQSTSASGTQDPHVP